MTRLSAFGSLRRGFASLRANRGLVWVQWVQALVLWVLMIAGALLPLQAMGIDLWTSYGFLVEGDPPPFTGAIERHFQSLAPALVAAVVAMLALWTLAFLVYCWFQAGTYGVLIAADRQAPPGDPRDRRLFRTFSGRDFAGWAGRYLWRYFWLVNLFALLSTPVLVLAMIWFVLVALGAEHWGIPAAFGIGCGGALPIGFLIAVLGLGMWLAMADAAREGSGPWAAVRNGMRVLGRRLGASTLLTLLLAAFVGLQVLAMLASTLLIETVTGERTLERAAAILALNAGQWLVAAVVGVLFSAAAVALVQSELRSEPQAAPRSAAA